MDIINYRKYLLEEHTTEASNSRINRAKKAERILGCTLDSIVNDDDKMDDALNTLKKHGDPHNNMQNALLCYYIFKNKKKYPNIMKSWKSQKIVFIIVKNIYKDDRVYFQARPDFLKTDKGGQMSYDIYIPEKKIAIEYQGKQHYEPIEFFGGKESFDNIQRRDREKKEISEKLGIKLVYITYLDPLNEKLIREKI